MPIHVAAEIRRMDEEEYKACVYEAMSHIFDVQRDLGRLFHEKIYQREAAFRIPGAQRRYRSRRGLRAFARHTTLIFWLLAARFSR